MRSEATTVDEYLASLPPDRREAIEAVRAVILKNLPKGYVEQMAWGVIGYVVPFEVYRDTYNKQPLQYAGLASQKNYMAVYLNSIYTSEEAAAEFEREYRATGKRYDVGKSCVRFRKLDDLPLPLIGRHIKATPMKRFVEIAQGARAEQAARAASRSAEARR
jgi:hypothetical protein